MDSIPLTEVPQNLQMLVRLIVRGFYSVEDVLIVDMLVRNICMSEDDLCDLLKFDRKMLRSRINTLKADKLLQARTQMATTEDGRNQKEQYYFINYKSFVNVVKYKLDHIRKKLEMEKRDQTSRASFKCMHCQKTYIDLEADQLLDIRTGNLHCIICRQEVQEDKSNVPRHDTRILLTNFNEQMEPLFSLLREVENIKLAAEFSEPKPQDFSSMRRSGQPNNDKKNNDDGKAWSGESSKNNGFQVDSSIDVNINTENGVEETVLVKEKPIWLTEATSFLPNDLSEQPKIDPEIIPITSTNPTPENSMGAQDDDVLSLLRQHEKKGKRTSDSETDDSNDAAKKLCLEIEAPTMPSFSALGTVNEIEEITISDDESDEDETEPLVSVGSDKIPLSAIDNDVISRMTQEEKNQYIHIYQDYYRGMDY